MKASEAGEAKKLARKSFGLIEVLFMPKPKDAFVAIAEDKIVGGFVYKFENCSGKKYGFVSFLFTDPSFHGQGIGKKLMEEGIPFMWKQGCDALVTYVRDDNVASWILFERKGFVKASLPKIAGDTGFFGALKLCFNTAYVGAVGHEFYIAKPDNNSTSLYKKEGGPGQIAAYVIMSLLMMIPIISRVGDISQLSIAVAAFGFVFLGCVLAGYLGTLFSKKRLWQFRLTSGGAFVYPAISIATGGFLPWIGSWYPSHYENTLPFKRDMAINAIAVWVFLLSIMVVRLFTDIDSLLLRFAANLCAPLLIIRCLPISVFDSLGFGRVYKWNKVVLVTLVGASIYLSYIA